jgi:hypothetical protein
MNETWRALADEAGIAAQHLGVGVTAFGRARPGQEAYYAQAFFALSVGLERSCKLILVIDRVRETGEFPPSGEIKAYGHDLSALMNAADVVAQRLGIDVDERLPDSKIHRGIVGTLSNFANNMNRYYNLDLVTGAKGVEDREDPIAEWGRRVSAPVLRTNFSNRSHEFDSIRRWERMYVMQLGRFVSQTFFELDHCGSGRDDVPYFSDFFFLFLNSDSYFRNRKTWSIYKP